MVIRTKKLDFSRYVYQFLTRNEILDHLQLIAETRSGTFPQITFDEVKRLKIIIPQEEILKKFNKIIIDFSTHIKNNWLLITNIEKTRDYLLPKLMSGEIRV
jgi:type I restriction enzyme S subunit